MYMSTVYVQNIVPKKCAFGYVKMCIKKTSLMLKQRAVISMVC